MGILIFDEIAWLRQGTQSFAKHLNINAPKYVVYADFLMGPIRALRSFGNELGLAWWAKVDTMNPETTYWFGPFLTRRSLKNHLTTFLDDLVAEGSRSNDQELIRCRRVEPLTIEP